MKKPECVYVPKEYFTYFKKFITYANENSKWFRKTSIPVKTALKLFLFSKFLESQGDKYTPTDLTNEGNKVMCFLILSNLPNDFLGYTVLKAKTEYWPDGDLLVFVNKRGLVKSEEEELKKQKEAENNIRIKINAFDLKEDFNIHQKNLKKIGEQINYSKLRRMAERNEDLVNKNFHHLTIPFDYYTNFKNLINEYKVKNPYLKLTKNKKLDDFEINTMKEKSNFGSIDW